MAKVIITGAAGFIGSHMVEHFLKHTDWELILVDRLSYAANGMSRLRDIRAMENKRVQMYTLDVSYPIPIGVEREIGSVDYIVHLAAETHVDRSIADPRSFVQSNVMGTMEMLQFARKLNSRLKKFIMFSTDEVFGPAPEGHAYKEWDRYNSTNPYSATKAASEELCLAWANSYSLPMVITHCMNNFGERQHPEKFIPSVVKKLLSGQLIQIHADPQKTKAGSRNYIHARNVAAAILHIIQKVGNESHMGKVRDKFNITGEQEVDNLTLVKMIHKIMEIDLERKLELNVEMVDYHSSRPGHDLRYALDGTKLEKMGWKPPTNFEESLTRTIKWMIDSHHLQWLMLD